MTDHPANKFRALRTAIILVLLAASIAGYFRLKVDTTLEPMLPTTSDARGAYAFLNNSSLASRFFVWIRLTDTGKPDQLFAAADDVEKHLDHDLVTGVMHPPAESDAMDKAVGLLDHSGELLDENALTDVEQLTTPAALSKRMHECYMQLLQPQGSFMQSMLRHDPLGISPRILGPLLNLTKGMGFQSRVENGRLVHPDGRQLLLVLETKTSATNLEGSQKLLEELNHLAATAPAGVQIIPYGAQIHTVENQALMQRDTRLAGTANAIIFMALFLIVSRDWRVASIFLLPVLSIGVTIGLCALVHPQLSLMVIGIALTMAGSAVDYGIFVYTAVSTSSDRKADLRRIRIPLLISHLTTLGVFLAFLFSAIPAYRQLGWLTSISLVLSLLAALFVLPNIIKPGGKILLLGRGMPLRAWGGLMKPVLIVGAVALLVALFFAGKTNFNSDISRLDGISPAFRQVEKDFEKTWSRSDADLGIIAVTGHTREQAAYNNDQIYRRLKDHFAQGDLVSLSSVWPSQQTRRENLARWTQFWTPQRIAQFRKDLDTAGEPFGFAADAFEPFLQALDHPPGDDDVLQLTSSIETLFISPSGNDFQMLNFFPDTPENVKTLRQQLADHPEVQVVSRRAMADAFANAAVSETKLLVGISAAFIVLFLLALTRSLVRSFLIMLPAFVGLIAMLAALALCGFSMNMVTVVAAIAVLALASDYGVFAVYAWDNKEPLIGQGMASIHLCAMTTAVGTAALLFAHHPALLLVGVSLTSGLVGGYATGLFIIPGLMSLMERRKDNEELAK
jgi:predicted exporter